MTTFIDHIHQYTSTTVRSDLPMARQNNGQANWWCIGVQSSTSAIERQKCSYHVPFFHILNIIIWARKV